DMLANPLALALVGQTHTCRHAIGERVLTALSAEDEIDRGKQLRSVQQLCHPRARNETSRTPSVPRRPTSSPVTASETTPEGACIVLCHSQQHGIDGSR